ncbi:S41 family peptidase [Sphingobacterium griseoflavum]|uniref:Tail specific protease domain-containing protein n=1 Tax=Sphingobacterium griseoflavum TaxID=1474952 RepID=A0ABQ3HQ30_9SPHI|nr:S41 family peptidase [Sphingobacterium griseoflavum]GHE23381.1 hypothetical protein GCM10017764_03490 [Sphingobacterium griseoflavum]
MGSNEALNHWQYAQMERYYYWAHKLPKTIDYGRSPDDFFHMLLAPEDRFSSILQSRNERTFGKTLTNTFGIDLLTVDQEDQSLHILSQVVPFSNGALAGLARGDSIVQINGIDLRFADMKQTVNEALSNNTLRLTLKNGKDVELPSSYIAQPVLYAQAILNDPANSGYLYLSHFDFAGAYDLLYAVKTLKDAKVSQLILDLRYNPGGQVSFAAFCALLFAPVSADDIFVRYRGNDRMANIDDTFADALARQADGYSFTASELIAARLPLQRIAILTTPHTASAAELLINSLRPYVEVVHVGEATMGKDMASVTLTSPPEVNGENASWHILPLVYKIYNRELQGDYEKGISPQRFAKEYQTLPLYPFGDMRDPLVKEALTSATRSSSKQPLAIPKRTVLRFESRPYEHMPMLRN